MIHDEIIKEFLETFPEFSDIAAQEFSCWRGRQPPLHIFFSSVLDPFLVKELNSTTNPALLARLFEYLEKLAGSNVKGVEEALVSTLAWVGNFDGLISKANQYMGPKTLSLSKEVERYWSRSVKV
jgi:hypothetical protein